MNRHVVDWWNRCRRKCWILVKCVSRLGRDAACAMMVVDGHMCSGMQWMSFESHITLCILHRMLSPT
jgi:hypothetical protein